MAIDIDSEELVHFGAARKEFPRPPCLQTLHRWRLDGVRGVRLDTILIGGQRYTSLEAIRRFIAAQNSGNSTQPAPAMTAPKRQRQAAAAMATLATMGVTPAHKLSQRAVNASGKSAIPERSDIPEGFERVPDEMLRVHDIETIARQSAPGAIINVKGVFFVSRRLAASITQRVG